MFAVSSASGLGAGTARSVRALMPPPANPIAAQVPVTTSTPTPLAQPSPTVAAVPTAGPISTPVPARPKVAANELGTIPILEFHVIANAEEDQWTNTPEHLRRDLQILYDAGYRPISMADLLDRHIDIPAGTSPVVFTFDDSSPGQFRFLEQNGQTVVDPNSAVGILEAFHDSHPDWQTRGVFYVLPEAAQPHKMFGQPKYEAEKLRYLVARGFEIGNHTWWHQRLDTVGDEEVQRQLAFAARDIQQAVPGYTVRTFALPLGLWPKNRSLAFAGSYQGASYRNEAVVLVGAEPAPSPNSKEFDPRALPRVQGFDDNIDKWIRYLAKSPDEHYVSDGDPSVLSVPVALQAKVDRDTLGPMRLSVE